MKKIELKDIKVGDCIYLENKKETNFRCVLKKTPNKEKGMTIFNVFWLKDKSKSTHLFEPRNTFKNPLPLGNETFNYYMTYKLNKKEVLKFTKMLILMNLE